MRMVLLLICMLFISRLYELLFPTCFGLFGDLLAKAKHESENNNYRKGVSNLADTYFGSYIWDEAFLASFIKLTPILLLAYKADIIMTDWFIMFYVVTIISTTIIYGAVNFFKSNKTIYRSYHPNFYRVFVDIVVFLSFSKIFESYI